MPLKDRRAPSVPPPETPQATIAENRQTTAILAKIELYPGDWKALLKKIAQERQEIVAILEQYL